MQLIHVNKHRLKSKLRMPSRSVGDYKHKLNLTDRIFEQAAYHPDHCVLWKYQKETKQTDH